MEHMKVPELKAFLKARGMTVSDYKKNELLRLAEIAVELNLPVLAMLVDDTVKTKSTSRTSSLDSSGNVVHIPKVEHISQWSSELSSIPEIEQTDVFVYLVQGGWGSDKLRQWKGCHGNRLQQDGHVCNVQMCSDPGPDYTHMSMLTAQCVRETSLNEKPYMVWLSLENNGAILTAGCECPA
jgi:hypothetical protein